MKAVRFKKEYSDIPDVRLSYELVDDKLHYNWNEQYGPINEPHYNTKLLGLVPAYKMEQSEDTDTPAIDVFIALANM